MIDAVLNLLFPQACIVCNHLVLERRWGAACPDCWNRLKPLVAPFCSQCGMPADAIEGRCGPCRRGDWAFDFGRSALIFDDTLRDIVHHLKYQDRVSLAKPLGDLLKACVDSEPFTAEAVVPVPLHRWRQRQRGFNQAELLAERLQRPLLPHLLRRRKNTPSQTGLTRPQRALNLAGAFEVRGPAPKAVLVVDDVYTTGATLNEIAKVLKRSGVERVEIATAARVPSPGPE